MCVCVHKPWLKGGDSDGDTRDVGGFVCQFSMSFAAAAVVVAIVAVAIVAIVVGFLFGQQLPLSSNVLLSIDYSLHGKQRRLQKICDK